jgi:hypothetical protein
MRSSVPLGPGSTHILQSADVDWFAVQVTPMHLCLKLQALCAPLVVSSVNSRGAPRHAGVRDLLAREKIGREMACDPTSM